MTVVSFSVVLSLLLLNNINCDTVYLQDKKQMRMGKETKRLNIIRHINIRRFFRKMRMGKETSSCKVKATYKTINHMSRHLQVKL